jgi:hypothetical protein
MRGGETVAKSVHSRLCRGSRKGAAGEAAAEIRRALPGVGVDTGSFNRVAVLEVNRVANVEDSLKGASGPFLGAIKRLTCESAYETGVAGSAAWRVLNDSDPRLAIELERTHELLLDRLANGMPFVTEAISASVRSHMGPIYAAAVLAAANPEGETRVAVPDAGVAVEAVGAIPRLLGMLVDRAPSKQLQANNALAVLTVDFAATRALIAADRLGDLDAVAALGHAFRQGCQGSMRDAAARFSVDRTVEDWYRAAQETSGATAILATRFAAAAAGESVAVADGLRPYALELGVAIRLAEEIVDLTAARGPLPDSAAAGLRRGVYTLPVLFALEVDPSLSGVLGQHLAQQLTAAEVVAHVEATGAIEWARARCRQHAELASSLACKRLGGDGGALARLAGAPVEHVFASSFDAQEAC